jgi:hypothetical protein
MSCRPPAISVTGLPLGQPATGTYLDAELTAYGSYGALNLDGPNSYIRIMNDDSIELIGPDGNSLSLYSSGHQFGHEIGLVGTVLISNSLIINGAIGFFGHAAAVKPTITGLKGANAALASLLTGLASLGLIVDSSGT